MKEIFKFICIVLKYIYEFFKNNSFIMIIIIGLISIIMLFIVFIHSINSFKKIENEVLQMTSNEIFLDIIDSNKSDERNKFEEKNDVVEDEGIYEE